jgi:hypothetical protein
VKGIELDELQSLFGESRDDPMYHSYDVTQSQAKRLGEAAGVQLDLDNTITSSKPIQSSRRKVLIGFRLSAD